MQFQNNYPLKNVTTLCIGGPARIFAVVKSQDELIEAIKYAKQKNLSYLIIGGGSNLLVADEGFEELAIKNKITGITRNSNTLSVKSGTILQDLINYANQQGLGGLQNLAGIPGTVGGAVYGNAGAYGQTISGQILSVTTLDIDTLTVKQFSKEDCVFDYRNSVFKKTKQPILEITFLLQPGNSETLTKEAEEIISKRLVKYPAGIKCPGSFFKNILAADLPKEILDKIPKEKIVYGKLPAGALLEDVGAKDQSEDGIIISPNHANLFINKGNGTAKAFYTLAKKYAGKVKEKFGIVLEPEVQFVNIPPFNL